MKREVKERTLGSALPPLEFRGYVTTEKGKQRA
jgi:hypothetical protein